MIRTIMRKRDTGAAIVSLIGETGSSIEMRQSCSFLEDKDKVKGKNKDRGGDKDNYSNKDKM